MKKYFLFLFVLFSVINISSQPGGSWKIYTSLKDVKALSFYQDNIWAATSGGAFRYSPSDGSFTKYNRVNGFFGISLTAVSPDNFGNIWFGSSNGSVDFIPANSEKAQSIPDIYISDNINKQINSFELSGDTIIAAHDFGISIINTREQIFKDTYLKFGGLATNTKVNYAVKYDRIYAATNNGVILQKPGATNLLDNESWLVNTTADGLPSNTIFKVQFFNGELIAATNQGLSRLSGTAWSNFIDAFNHLSITDICVKNDSLYIIENNKNLFVYANNILTQLYSYTDFVNRIYSEGNIYAATTEGIVKNINADAVTILPNGPKANLFISLTVDQSSTLWVASGSDRSGIGYYAMKDEVWTNYNIANTPSLPSNAYFINYTAPDNTVYFGNWGSGFLRIKNNIPLVFTKDITGMQGISKDPNFVVVTSFATDSRNNLWVMNFGANDRKILTMFSPSDSSFKHFSVPVLASGYAQELFNLTIDPYDTKWFSIKEESRKDLYYFNENKTPDNPNDDVSGVLSEFDDISSIVVDKRGDVWVATNLGVYILSNTQSVFASTPSVRRNSIFTLRQQTVNCMLVDPLNQKWIGTNEGLLLVNSDGTSLLAAYDTKNSPLLSNIIRSIAIDENTGRIYVGTDQGIISFETSSIKPKETFSDIFVYPSPFKLNGTDRRVTIDGLVKDSDIKILTITGKLIKQFSSPGGRIAYWDGKDNNGTEVSSGIYIIVAYDKEGNNVATGKIAVLKE